MLLVNIMEGDPQGARAYANPPESLNLKCQGEAVREADVVLQLFFTDGKGTPFVLRVGLSSTSNLYRDAQRFKRRLGFSHFFPVMSG